MAGVARVTFLSVSAVVNGSEADWTVVPSVNSTRYQVTPLDPDGASVLLHLSLHIAHPEAETDVVGLAVLLLCHGHPSTSPTARKPRRGLREAGRRSGSNSQDLSWSRFGDRIGCSPR